MDDWFTVEEIDAGTFAISEYKHWEEPHCYLLCGCNRAILIDTGAWGFKHQRSCGRFDGAANHCCDNARALGSYRRSRAFRADSCFCKRGGWLDGKFPLPLDAVKKNLASKPCDFPSGFCIDDYKVFQGKPAETFSDGACFDLGGRKIFAVHAPEHSPGHCCFYEPARNYLFSGDLVYSGCLDAFYPTTDPRAFFQSVRKIGRLDVERVLPGHHNISIPVDIIRRIESAFEGL